MKYVPRPYQVPAAEFLERTNYRALLGLRMGLGKSVLAASAAEHLLRRYEVGRVLIVAPPSVARITWPAEFAKWEHLRWIKAVPLTGGPVFHRNARLKGEPVKVYRPSWENTPGDVHLASYEQLATKRVKDRIYTGLVDLYKHDWPYDLVIFDEVHRMKTPSSRRFAAFRKVVNNTRHRIALSGSLGANSLLDLWGPAYLIDQGHRLGRTFTDFRNTYFVEAHNGFGYEARPNAEQDITAKLADICLMMKHDLGLAEPVVNNVTVPFPEAARADYNRLKREAFLRLQNGEVEARNPAALTSKLEQMANGAVYLDGGGVQAVHDAKLDALADVLADGEPVLCVTQFRTDWDRIRARFPFASQLDVPAWNSGRLRLMVLQASQGEGLNLQAGGHTVVWFCPTWNLVHYEQMNARLHRQGQIQTVVVHHLLAEDSIDQVKLARLHSKAALQDSLYEALKP